MNYLAHAYRALHDPWLLAGTSLPDWLRAIDRRARVRPAAIEHLPLAAGSPEARLRAGVLRHHDDDLRFHTLPAFDALTHEAVHAVRALSPDPRLRASVLGHVAVEMLLDAAIEARDPGSTERYYDALEHVDTALVARTAEAWTARALPALPHLLERFRRARFLFLYGTDDGVVDALSGLCARAGLSPPPPGTDAVVATLRPRVAAAAEGLLGV